MASGMRVLPQRLRWQERASVLCTWRRGAEAGLYRPRTGTGNNYAVVEVKSPLVDGDGIRDDIQKLVRFRDWDINVTLYLLLRHGSG